MSYARKVSIKYQNLKTYNDFFINLWSTLSFLFKSCNRVDIVFDVYKENSIKAYQQRRRTTGEDTETIISSFDQPLHVEIAQFLSAWKNKAALQKLFIKWVLNKVNSEQFDKPLFLGDSHKENDAMCVSSVNGLVSVERLLECTHKEADGRIPFYANHAIKIKNYGSVVIASSDTDIIWSQYTISAKSSTLIWKSYGLFQVEEISEHSSKKQSCQERSWLLPLTVCIWHGCIE